ncbi:MAG: amidoligase family protein [Microlunatus sp.]|nr:amidoligase family protein [Microlunatus sp.]
MDDAQVQSVFHRLRHDPPPGLREGPDGGWDRATMVERIFTRAELEIDANPTLRPQRREGLRTRLTQSRGSTGMLPDDSLSALVRLQAGVQEAQAATERRLCEIAGQRGMSLREVRAEFAQLRAEAPQGRQRRANAEELRDLGAMPTDPATRYAIATMRTRPSVHPPVRLVQQWLPVNGHPQISHVGVSDLSNRVEFRGHDGAVTAVSDAALVSVTAARGAAMSRPLPADVADGLFRSGQSILPGRLEATAFALRCDFCGRFTSESGHDCSGRNARIVTTANEVRTNGSSEIALPPVRAVVDAVSRHDGPVVLDGISCVSSGTVVSGSVIARSGGEVITGIDRRTRQVVDIDDAAPDLHCSGCQASSCPHTADAVRQIRHHLTSSGRLTGNAAGRAARQEQLHGQFQIRPRPQQQPPDQPSPAAVSFLSNPESFRAVIQGAGPDRQVQFMTENACDGLAADTRFGVELEFNGDSHGTRGDVADRLSTAGLIRRASYNGYHSAAARGYPAGEYSLENDGSVSYGGELVTCIESDHPDSWNRIQRACQAIRDGGGTTHYAGSHTNISSDGFDPEHGWRLAHLVRAHEDDLLRMGRTPNSRRERGYNARLRHPGPAWDQTYSYGHIGMHRTSMVNFTRAFSRSSPRIEFRFPDASHDPGVIQGQVKLCAALTNYVRAHEVTPDEHRPAGTAHSEGWTNRLMNSSPDEWTRRTQGVRWLIDTLFTREQDRVQQAILWARGRYQRS